MTLQEAQNKLKQMQASALELIVSLAMLNHDTSTMLTALDTLSADMLADSLSAMGKSSKCVADSLDAFCDASQFLM